MSKLIQKLYQSYNQSPPLGFRSSYPQAQRMVVISLCTEEKEAMEIEKYVDGIVFPSGLMSPPSLKIPWGIFLPQEEEVGRIGKEGGDFIVVGSETSIEVTEEETGKIMLLSPRLPSSFIWSLNFLPVEGIALKMDEAPSNLSHLADIERFSHLIQKPLLLFLPSFPSIPQLKVLWKAGVEGIMVSQFSGKDARELNKITFPPRRKGKIYASLGESLQSLSIEESDGF